MRVNSRIVLRAGGALLSLACALPALANDEEGSAGAVSESSVALHGFGTAGVARSTNGNGEIVHDLSQPGGIGKHWSGKADSLFGVQANWHVNDGWEVVAQAVSHYRYDGSFRPELTWAFLKFDPNPAVTLRLGRFGTEFFMLADSRMVGYSYLPVRPPTDFFANLPINYVDGVHGRFTAPLADWLARVELYTGVAREKLPAASDILDLNGSLLSGISLDMLQGPWQARLSYAQLRFDSGIPSLDVLGAQMVATGIPAAMSVGRNLQMAGALTRYHSFGVIYDDGLWQAHFDYNYTSHTNLNFQDSHSAYVLVGRRVGKFTPFAGYSWTRSKTTAVDTGVPALDATVSQIIAWSGQDQRTLMLGTRWDFARNMDLKAQLDIQRGSPDSVALVQNENAAWDGSTKVFSLSFDFIF